MMTDNEFWDLRSALNTDCERTLQAKGADYTRNKDRLSNFTDVAALLDVTAPDVCAVYLVKPLFAILRFLRDGHVESEPIHERFVDLRNYVDLLHACVVEEQKT